MANQIDVRAFREARGWTQAQLSQKLGVNQSTIHRWENQKMNFSAYASLAFQMLANQYPEKSNDPNGTHPSSSDGAGINHAD